MVISIVESGVDDELVFVTSMWDLIVAVAPADHAPVDAIAVRGAMANPTIAEGRIVVEHLPLVGRADKIERDASEAVPLFWRFLREKYGLEATQPR